MMTEELPVELSDEERIERARQLGEIVETITNKEIEKKAETKRLQSAIDELKRKRTQLAEVCRKGEELRQIECRTVCYWEDETVSIIRVDTGEIVRTRPMTSKDRQQKLHIASRRD